MKSLLFISSIIAVCCFVSSEEGLSSNRAYEKELAALLEKFRDIIPVGIPEKNIPILDPLKQDELKIAMDIPDVITFSVNMTKFSSTGLQHFIVNTAKISILAARIDFDLTIPKAIVEADNYIIDGHLEDLITLFGNGTVYTFFTALANAEIIVMIGSKEFRVSALYASTSICHTRMEAQNLNIKGNASISIFEPQVSMKTFKINIGMEKMHCNFEGLLGTDFNSEVINRVLEDVLPNLLKTEEHTISKAIGDKVMAIINPILKNYTLEDIINIILGNSGSTTIKPT